MVRQRMKALILDDIVVEVAQKEFPVASPLTWCDCPHHVQQGWRLESGTFLPPTLPTLPPTQHEDARPREDSNLRPTA